MVNYSENLSEVEIKCPAPPPLILIEEVILGDLISKTQESSSVLETRGAVKRCNDLKSPRFKYSSALTDRKLCKISCVFLTILIVYIALNQLTSDQLIAEP